MWWRKNGLPLKSAPMQAGNAPTDTAHRTNDRPHLNIDDAELHQYAPSITAPINRHAPTSDHGNPLHSSIGDARILHLKYFVYMMYLYHSLMFC